ncbi:hypothetical protein M9H77_24427 [Catharanthus roseus]|uniref:Uncharacterized protein n=1 Tax=Catharanthus roseus TaxID=4058 RepID=A0ACC0AX32_CATRO|nr:hypothetical protein M9H77_24427 [Catharanthus roseus]
MELPCFSFIVFLLLSCFATSSQRAISFSSLQRTLILTTSPSQGQDSSNKTIKVKLCYAPISQVDRVWRKTVDSLEKDKTCQFKIVAKPYSLSNNCFTWTTERDIPTTTYFVRAYAYNSAGKEVAFGQSTDAHKTINLFEIRATSGCHTLIDIAAACISAFSTVSLLDSSTWRREKPNQSSKDDDRKHLNPSKWGVQNLSHGNGTSWFLLYSFPSSFLFRNLFPGCYKLLFPTKNTYSHYFSFPRARVWRKTVDSLEKDKTCQFKIVAKPYSLSNNCFTWTTERDIPTTTYFVRAYAYNSAGKEVAFGQSTDAHKTINLFEIRATSGCHTLIDIAAACISAFSTVSLFGFLYLEK